jgi:hypothetical protein
VREKLLCFVIRSIFVVGFLLAFSFSNAQIALWNYDPLVGANASPTPNTGSGSSSIVGTAQPADNSFQGKIAAGCGAIDSGNFSWSFTGIDPGSSTETNGVQYNVSTAGYKTIIFKWQMRCSNTAPNTVRLQYTTNGSTWVNGDLNVLSGTPCSGVINANGTYTISSINFVEISADFTSIPAVENNANFGVRILAAYDPAFGVFSQNTAPSSPFVMGAGATWRFDNASVSGTLIPAPTAVTLAASATTVCAGSPINLNVTFTGGVGPFTLTYTDTASGSNVVVNNYTSGTLIPVTPSATTTYSIVSFAHASGTLSSGFSGTPAVTVTALPIFNGLSAAATSVCYSASLQTTPLTYTSVSGTPVPNRYSITWNTSPANSFVTVTNATLVASTVTISIPAATPAGTYTGTITIKNSLGSCVSIGKTFTVTVKPATSISVQPSSAVQTFCVGEASTPLSVTATGAPTVTYLWRYDADTSPGGTFSTGVTTSTYTPTVVGSYYYYVVVTGGCGVGVQSSYTGLITVLPGSVAGTVSGTQTICGGTSPSTSLTLAGNTGNVVKWERADDVAFTTNVSDIANTTTTLTGAAIGVLWKNTYFRAYVQNGACSIVTTVPVLVTVNTTTYASGVWSNGSGPSSTIAAVFSEDYSSTGDLNACSVKVSAGNVVINSNHTLTVENGVTVSGGTLTFENNASLMQNSSTAVNTGAINYKRQTPTAISKFDYTYWSSPVYPQTLSNFSPNTLSDKYFWFYPTTYTWQAVAVPGLTNMTSGQGYIIRGPQSNVTAAIWEGTFSGVPNNGDITPNVTAGNSVVYTDSTHNLNCLGNPYPSALSADLLMSGNPATLGTGSTIYFWTHNTGILNNAYNADDYAVYNYTGGTGTNRAIATGANTNIPNGKIAAGQGFMIKALATGTVTFKNSMRLSGSGDNTQFFRTNQSSITGLNRSRVWLDLENTDGAFKQILVGYVENATNDLEDGYDGEVLEAGNPVSFYSILNAKKLSIQGRALPFEETDAVPLGLHISSAGNYTIALSQTDGMFENGIQPIYIEDKALNVLYNLHDGAYSFVSEQGTFDGRFVLRFNETTLAAENPSLADNAIIAYKNNDQIIIRSGITMKSFRVFDVAGRLLWKNETVQSKEAAFISGNNHEILMIEIILEDNTKVIKKVIN